MCLCIFYYFYVIGPKSYTEFGEITQTIRPLRHSRSFKVTDFGTNRKPICDFILLININLPTILHRFQVTAMIICQIFASDKRRFTITPSLGVISPENMTIFVIYR